MTPLVSRWSSLQQDDRRGLLILMAALGAVALAAPAHAHLCIIRQGLESAGSPETGDRYGDALASGDFNGDGYDDLAAAATGENEDISGSNQHGSVVVSYGSAYGTTHVGADYLTAGAPPDPLVRFGAALASGDFNNDGYDDLAAGAPESDGAGGILNAGLVHIFYGAPGGPPSSPNATFDEEDAGGAIEAGDEFGNALAAGDFNGDGYDDLAVGAYGEDSDAGAIFTFYGGPGGLTTAGAGWMKQSTLGYASTPGDWFGWSLAAGNVVGTDHDDLVVGTPRKTVATYGQAGQYYIIRGSAGGLTTSGVLMENASTLGVGASSGANFAFSLALGQFFATTGSLDLAVGEPRHNGPGGVTDAGRVVVIAYDSIPAGGTGPLILVQSDDGEQVQEDNDQFGYALAAGDFNDDGYDDLAVGSPYEDFVIPAGGILNGGGLVQIFQGSPGGPYGWAQLTYDTENLNDQWGVDDNLGRAVAFGHFDDSGRANLAVGAPGKDFVIIFPADEPDIDQAGSVFIVAPWRQVQNLACWSSVAFDCENTPIFSQKPFDMVRQASTTKAMTLLLASEWADPSHPMYDPMHTDTSSTYVVPAWVADTTKIGGSLAHLKGGQIINLAGLMKAMIPVSGNEAAYAIADQVTGGGHAWNGLYGTVHDFVIEMNARAAELGMTRTHFTTPKGSNDPSDLPAMEDGAHTTAWDFAILARAVMQNDLAALIVGKTPWWVPSLKLVGPGMYQPFLDKYSNNFLLGVQAQVGAIGADAGGLLKLAIAECSGPLIAIPATPPPPPPLVWTLPDIPADDDSAWGGMLQPDAGTPDSLEIEVLAKTLVTASTSLQLDVSRSGSLLLEESGDMVRFSIGPCDSHQGGVLMNRSGTTASFTVLTPGGPGPETVNLRPGEVWSIPAWDVPGTSLYEIEIASTSTEPVALDYFLSGWRTDVTLTAEGSGIPTGPLTCRKAGGGELYGDALHFSLRGMDPDPGNVVTLTVQAAGVVPTSVAGETGGSTVAAPRSGIPVSISPNPFQPATNIRFALGAGAPVRLDIYDVTGRRVRSLLRGERMQAGVNGARWDGRDDAGRPVAAGVYYSRVEAAGASGVARMVRLP